MKQDMKSLEQLCVNTIRTLSVDAVQKANSGHPGLPMGAAPMAFVLFHKHLRHHPQAPDWPDRDRFVLSAGHGSILLYSLLHLTGYDVSLSDLQAFRQWGSKTAGHPESFLIDGVEATTGPLGQGVGNAVGMAVAERSMAGRFNRPGHEMVDHFTYAIVSDGDLMEGVAAEACSFAGHYKLGKLIFLYDDNGISLDGPTSLSFTGEDVEKRFEAYGWHVQRVEDGDTDLDAIDSAIRAAKNETGRPSLIAVKTTIGFGSPSKQGTSDAHGSPLGEDEIRLMKETLGWEKPDESFHVPKDALDSFRTAVAKGQDLHTEWNDRFASYKVAHPDLAVEWDQAQRGELVEGWDSQVPRFEPSTKLATRAASGKVLNSIAPKVPFLLGGDADLSGSTKTALSGEDSFDGQTGLGRNIHFGVREHGMASIANGMAYHGGVRPYVATFFCFVDYMRPSVRISALCSLPVIYVWTHDSIGLGEDGPTHQPVEQLASLRCMPNFYVFRPADASETAESWKFAMSHKDGPVGLVLSRQGLPEMDHEKLGSASGVWKGAYVLADSEGTPEVVIIATGSEVQLAMDARDELAADGLQVRVVSMPCWKLFESQSLEYRESVIPTDVPARVAVEAGSDFGWTRWVGDKGEVIGLNRFGASAPSQTVLANLGFTVSGVVAAAHKVLERVKTEIS